MTVNYRKGKIMKAYKVEHIMQDWDSEEVITTGYFKNKEDALSEMEKELASNWRKAEFVLSEISNIVYKRESDCQTEIYYLEEIELR